MTPFVQQPPSQLPPISFSPDSSGHCVLCLNCVRSCPHHSMRLDLRNPTSGVFNKARRAGLAICASAGVRGNGWRSVKKRGGSCLAAPPFQLRRSENRYSFS